MLGTRTHLKQCPACKQLRDAGELWCENCNADLSRVALHNPEAEARRREAAARPDKPADGPVKLCACGRENHVQARRCSACHRDIALAPHLRRADTPFALLFPDGPDPFPVGGSCPLGRFQPPVSAVADNRFVSRRHALLECLDGSLFLTDEGSVNGVYVNGSRLEPGAPRRLQPGDRVSLGGLWEGERGQPGAAHFTIHAVGSGSC